MNCILLKWGSLKSWYFTDDFVENNKQLVEELSNLWDKIYQNTSGAISGSEKVQNDYDLKIELINTLEKFYDLGVPFENNFTDEYYNNFDEIKDYILNYGK